MTIPHPLGLLARGLNVQSLAFHSVEDHPPLLAIVAEGVFPLAFLGQDAEPLLRDLGCGQLAVVLEDDGCRVSCLKRHLIGTLDDGDALTDEGIPKHVARPFHLEGAGQCGYVGLQLLGADDFSFPLQRGEPCGEVVADGDHAAGGGLGLAGTNLDELPLQIHRFPIESFELGHADPGEGSDGEDGHQIGRGIVQQLRHFLGGE